MRLSELNDANDILDNPQALTERYERDGCLLVRDALAIPDLIEVIDHTVAVLERWRLGKVAPRMTGEPPSPRWTGRRVGVIDDEELHRARTLNRSTEEFRRFHDALQETLDHVCCRPMHQWAGGYLRVNFPDDPVFTTPPHQDGYARSPSGDYRRTWVALTDIPFGDNGLAVAPGSHRLGKLPHGVAEYRTRSTTIWGPGRRRTGVDPGVIENHWHTAHMRPGDAIVFSSDLLHRSLPAISDRIRVAVSVSSSAEGSPRPIATFTTPEDIERVRKIRELGTPLGLAEKDVMGIRADLLMTGLPVNETTVRAAMAGEHAGWRQEMAASRKS